MHLHGCTCTTCVLSRELASTAGFRLVVQKWQEAGVLKDGESEFHWWKCPQHDVWLQPEVKPYPHWKCMVQGCTFTRAAKMRTRLERRIFQIAIAITLEEGK
jgi:hypothetical protein